jgi:hypothetical protein
VNEYEELLADNAEVRAEVSDDLSLGTINSRPDRRGSEATVVSYTGTPSKTGATKDASEESEPDLIAKWGKKKAKKIAGDAYAVEDGVMYDMSFERSLFKTVTKPWWICFWLLFADCESWFLLAPPKTTLKTSDTLRAGTPLVSRQLIRQISISYASQSALAEGLPTENLEQPKPLYHVAGLALAIPIMVLTGVTLHNHWTARSYETGAMLRSAVRLGERVPKQADPQTIDLISRKSMYVALAWPTW